MKHAEFKKYMYLVDQLNDCVKAALYLMKNANYSEPCKKSSDSQIKTLSSNAILLKLQIETAIQEQFKSQKQCDTQR